YFFFQAEDGIRDRNVTGVQTCALPICYQEIQLKKQLEKAKGKEKVVDVDISDIQLIVEEKTSIPVTKLQTDEQTQMKNIAKNLAEKVIGQEEAVDKIAKAIRRSRAGLKSADRPIGSFLF